MKPKFLADADLRLPIVTGVLRRDPSIDFLTASSANLFGVKDPEVLRIAAQLGRVLVSHDVNTMPKHFREYQLGGVVSAGVLLIPQSLELQTAIEELVTIAWTSQAEEWCGCLTWLPL